MKLIPSLSLKTSGGKKELRPNCSFHALYRDILAADKSEDYMLVIQCKNLWKSDSVLVTHLPGRNSTD